MSRAVPWLLTALGAFIAFILVLNLREKDYYENGSLTPVPGNPAADPVFTLLVPEEIKHSCPTCGECVHPVQVVRNERTLSLHDHDGWYKLFWSSDETYYFEELQHLAACYENRTAEDPHGTWIIVAKVGPPAHSKAMPHDCGPVAQGIQFRYDLEVLHPNEAPPRPDRYIQALVYRYDGDKLPPTLRFCWTLQAREETNPFPSPCPCGKP